MQGIKPNKYQAKPSKPSDFRSPLKTEPYTSIEQSATAIVWTAQHSTRSYISLTDTSSWELASYCLSTKELPGEHAATT